MEYCFLILTSCMTILVIYLSSDLVIQDNNQLLITLLLLIGNIIIKNADILCKYIYFDNLRLPGRKFNISGFNFCKASSFYPLIFIWQNTTYVLFIVFTKGSCSIFSLCDRQTWYVQQQGSSWGFTVR